MRPLDCDLPCRSTMILNSSTLCAVCVVIGRTVSRATAILSRNNSSVQVSICCGAITPDKRPQGCRSASVMTFTRALKPLRPAASSHSLLELVAILHVPARRGVAGPMKRAVRCARSGPASRRTG